MSFGYITKVGFVKRRGKEFIRAIVDYPEGSAPDFTPLVVWKRLPVIIVVKDETVAQTVAKEGEK